jgi:hypothetical protein
MSTSLCVFDMSAFCPTVLIASPFVRILSIRVPFEPSVWTAVLCGGASASTTRLQYNNPVCKKKEHAPNGLQYTE